jgi:hypothetical protein
LLSFDARYHVLLIGGGWFSLSQCIASRFGGRMALAVIAFEFNELAAWPFIGMNGFRLTNGLLHTAMVILVVWIGTCS